MADYKKMYYTLFNKMTDLILEMQAVQQLTEELYVSCEEQMIELRVLRKAKKDSEIATP